MISHTIYHRSIKYERTFKDEQIWEGNLIFKVYYLVNYCQAKNLIKIKNKIINYLIQKFTVFNNRYINYVGKFSDGLIWDDKFQILF